MCKYPGHYPNSLFVRARNSLISHCKRAFFSFFFSPQALHYPRHLEKSFNRPSSMYPGLMAPRASVLIDLDHSTTSRGQHSLRGGHGTKGQSGASAGTIAVRLTIPTSTVNIPKNVVLATPIDADVKLNTSIVCTAGPLQERDTILKIKSAELMFFHTQGDRVAMANKEEKDTSMTLFLYSPLMNPFLNTLGEQGIECNCIP